MVWKVAYHDDLQIVELTISGRVTGPELLEAAASRIDLGQEKGITNYLIDGTELIPSRSTTLEILEIPEKVYFEKGMERTSRIAAVVPREPESHWIAEFYENASVNRGWRVQWFLNRHDAIGWLLGP